ncbi:hypothetical protein AVEN_174017-1 [Araneus ventricosus]|uniref:Uncharacterized protein n=1 Tax=Araneus ventricosus TaxID=182803 RepID=A0A4Y2HED4_ARAVE|nr:hypothetical protein AVEN_174017-1 [Araneus ventricosus]
MKMRSCPCKPHGCSNGLFFWSIIDDKSMIDQGFVTSTAPKGRPNQLFHAADNVSSSLTFSNQNFYLLLAMPTPCEKEMELLRKLRVEVETDEDSDFDKGPEDI